jgi:hypothetical protein
MAIQVISIDLPPGFDEQKLLDSVTPYLASLPNRPLNRVSNVTRVELFESAQNYLVLLTVDLGRSSYDQELLESLPEGSKVSDLGLFESLQAWSR